MIELDGSLQLTLDDREEFAVVAKGSQLTVEVNIKRKALRLLASSKSSREFAGRLSRLLYERGFTMTIVRKGKALARLGRDVPGTMAGRILGLPHVSLLPKSAKKKKTGR